MKEQSEWEREATPEQLARYQRFVELWCGVNGPVGKAPQPNLNTPSARVESD